MLTDKPAPQGNGETTTDTLSACFCFIAIFANDLQNTQGQDLVQQRSRLMNFNIFCERSHLQYKSLQ